MKENIIIESRADQIIKDKSGRDEIYIKTNGVVSDENSLVEIFNNHYINIVQKTADKATKTSEHSLLADYDGRNCHKIIPIKTEYELIFLKLHKSLLTPI